MNTTNNATDQEFACEDCGFTSPVPNEVCPNCSGRMVAIDAPAKAVASDESDDEEGGLDDASLAAGLDESTEEVSSLEALRAKEFAEDEDPAEDLNYGNDDE